MTARELISEAYAAFNRRDIDATLAFMSERVSWPKASEGGRVTGKQEIREYWTRQWAEFDPRVDVLDVVDGDGGTIDVKVHQIVKTLKGEVLSDSQLWHVYSIAAGHIERMDIKKPEGSAGFASTAFSQNDRQE